MSLESVFKLSLFMNMVDNVTGPVAKVTSAVDGSVSKLDGFTQSLGSMSKTGMVMKEVGSQMTQAALAPVEATFETQKALGELASLGVQDLGAVEQAAKSFSDTWAGTTKADFISAAYDIKSGIASLSDTGVAEYTNLASLTAKATKSTATEMTSLFATGYGIYKSYYGDLSDLQFGEMFSAGIAQSVKQFKTTGSGMAQAIQTLGASATTASVPLEEQLSILGMLQATMGGSEAGTKYKAFLRSAAKGGEALGLSFLDANGQLLSMPEVLDKLRGRFGETMDAAEKMELQKAFGDTEAVALIDLLYSKTGDLQSNIVDMYGSLGEGVSITQDMADTINSMTPDRFEALKQKIGNVTQMVGGTVMPLIDRGIDKGGQLVDKIGGWISTHQDLVRIIMTVVLALGVFLMVTGSTIAIVGGVGLIFVKTIGIVKGAYKAVKLISSGFETLQICALYAGDGIRKGFSAVKSFSGPALTAVKNFTLGMVGMAKQAIITGVQALPGLIASVWSFTAALLANPVTWIVIGIVALIAALYLLWKNWDSVTAWIASTFGPWVDGIKSGFDWISEKISGFIGFFMNIGPNVSQALSNAVGIIRGKFEELKQWLGGLPASFVEAGKNMLKGFVEGVLSFALHPVEAVKGIFQKVRNLMPFSDAKEGPLSSLTLSGQRTMTTFAEGISLAEDAPASAFSQGMEKTKLSLSQETLESNRLGLEKRRADEMAAEERKGVFIETLKLYVDFSKIKDLPKLLKLLKEIENYVNANGAPEEKPAPA